MRASVAVALVLLAGCGGGGGGSAAPLPSVSSAPAAQPTQGPAAGGGSGPAAGNGSPSFVPARGPLTFVPQNGGGAPGSTLLPSSVDGMFLVQSADTPAEDYSAAKALATSTVQISETSGLAASTLRRRSNTPSGNRPAPLPNDRETLWERPHPAFARAAASLRSVRGRRADERRRLAVTPAPAPALGASKQFKIDTSSIGNSGGACPTPHSGYDCYTTITATLEAQGAHGNVWVDDASLATAGEFAAPSSDFATVASDFDAYFAAESQIFGPPFLPAGTVLEFSPQCDAGGTTLPQSQYVDPDLTGTSGDAAGGRIDIVVTDVLKGTGEGGYFFGGNLFAQQVLNCQPAPRQVSNEVPMFVIGGNNYPTGQNLSQFNEPFWLGSDVPRTMSHEFQHYLHFMNKVLAPYVQGNANGGVADDAFIDEGCSMLAEDLVANGIRIDTPRYTYAFLLEPSLFSLTSFTGYQPNPSGTASSVAYGYYSNTAGSYGFSYLMLRYLYDRFGGIAAIKALYASQTAHTGPIVAATGGEPFAQFYAEFAAAIANQGQGGGVVSTDPRYTFGSELTLRGTVSVTSRRDPPLDTRTLTFGGPQAPEAFSGGVPAGLIAPPAPAAPAHYLLIDGATLFVPLPGPDAGGDTLRAGGGPAVTQGVMVQGALPTPPPASH